MWLQVWSLPFLYKGAKPVCTTCMSWEPCSMVWFDEFSSTADKPWTMYCNVVAHDTNCDAVIIMEQSIIQYQNIFFLRNCISFICNSIVFLRVWPYAVLKCDMINVAVLELTLIRLCRLEYHFFLPIVLLESALSN